MSSQALAPDPESIVAAVFGLVGDEWPTSETERRAWAERHGLPVRGRPVPELDARTPGLHFVGDGPQGWGFTQWRFHRARFTGLSWFVWAEADEHSIHTAAAKVRDAFDAAWPAPDQPGPELLADSGTWFAAIWHPHGREVQAYCHAPRGRAGGDAVGGCLQLSVAHRARAEAEEREARERFARRR